MLGGRVGVALGTRGEMRGSREDFDRASVPVPACAACMSPQLIHVLCAEADVTELASWTLRSDGKHSKRHS
jgi:hypothetical protein